MTDIREEIVAVWEREFDPKKNPPMPVTLYEDLLALLNTKVAEAKQEWARDTLADPKPTGDALEIQVAAETMKAVMSRIKLKDKTIADRVIEPLWRVERWRDGKGDKWDLEVQIWKLRILAKLTRKFNWAVFLLKPDNLAGVVGSRNPTHTKGSTKQEQEGK